MKYKYKIIKDMKKDIFNNYEIFKEFENVNKVKKNKKINFMKFIEFIRNDKKTITKTLNNYIRTTKFKREII